MQDLEEKEKYDTYPPNFLTEMKYSSESLGLKSMQDFNLNCSKALRMTPLAFIPSIVHEHCVIGMNKEMTI